MVSSILPFTRRRGNGPASATASPAPPSGGGSIADRTKAALAAAGVSHGGMMGGSGGVGRLIPGMGLPHVTLPTVQVIFAAASF